MGGAGFILAINLFVAGLFAVAFFLVAANNRGDRVAVWFGVAYLCGVGYYALEFALPFQDGGKLIGYLAFAAFFAALGAVTIGVAQRYRVLVPWGVLGSAVAVFLVANWFAFDLPRESLARQVLYQAPYAVLQGICALLILQSRRRHAMDVGLMALFTLAAVHFLLKPFVALLAGGTGADAAAYIGTNYALISQSVGAILGVGTGLVMLMVLVRDMLTDVTARSETDPLSGLLNRRGFEDRAEPNLALARRSGVPLVLVAIDLDHFKSINDTFGHDVGDAVIQSFAGLMRIAAPDGALISRTGGEEFAVLIPESNLLAGRLLAETIRSAFTTLAVAGVPEETRLTASFGVAESTGDESLSDLRRRADTALYAAKRGGRDRVALAADRSIDLMPRHPLAVDPPKRSRR